MLGEIISPKPPYCVRATAWRLLRNHLRRLPHGIKKFKKKATRISGSLFCVPSKRKKGTSKPRATVSFTRQKKHANMPHPIERRLLWILRTALKTLQKGLKR